MAPNLPTFNDIANSRRVNRAAYTVDELGWINSCDKTVTVRNRVPAYISYTQLRTSTAAPYLSRPHDKSSSLCGIRDVQEKVNYVIVSFHTTNLVTASQRLFQSRNIESERMHLATSDADSIVAGTKHRWPQGGADYWFSRKFTDRLRSGHKRISSSINVNKQFNTNEDLKPRTITYWGNGNNIIRKSRQINSTKLRSNNWHVT